MIASHTCSGVIRERFSLEAMWRRSRRRRFSVGVCSLLSLWLTPCAHSIAALARQVNWSVIRSGECWLGNILESFT